MDLMVHMEHHMGDHMAKNMATEEEVNLVIATAQLNHVNGAVKVCQP
jgi:hypothetical protein